MRTSRLRLRLALWFGVAFLVGLAAVDIGLYLFLHNRADRGLTQDLAAAAGGFVTAVRRERREAGEALDTAVQDALREWVGPESFAVFAADGAVLGTLGEAQVAKLGAAAPPERAHGAWEGALPGASVLRLVEARDSVSGAGVIRVVAARSTAPLRAYDSALLVWLAVSLPAVVLFALAAGYFLARRSLRPIEGMTQAIDAIGPDELDRRLEVGHPADELDVLADRFNALLARLAQALAQNRAFVGQAAHQLKTPLTIVRGETALALERRRDSAEYEVSLRRIRRAAEQMTHRVQSLLLLARAEAGERPPLTDIVELDGLALESADLMRGRAGALGRALELGRVEPAGARGNEPLLREALLELIENAVRHGAGEVPVTVSAYAADGVARIEVASGGPALGDVGNARPASPENGGLGLSVLSWIAAAHGGRLRYSRAHDRNAFALEWPVTG